MAIPEFQSFMLPLLRLVSSESLRTANAITHIADEFNLSEEDREERLAKRTGAPASEDAHEQTSCDSACDSDEDPPFALPVPPHSSEYATARIHFKHGLVVNAAP